MIVAEAVDATAYDEFAVEVASLQRCSERQQQEITQYARVLCARGLSPEHIINAVCKYAQIRSANSQWS